MALTNRQKRLIDNYREFALLLILGLPENQLNNIIDNAKANVSDLPRRYKKLLQRVRNQDNSDTVPDLGDEVDETNPDLPND